MIFYHGDDEHTFEPKPLTLRIITVLDDIRAGNLESESADREICEIFVERIDGEPIGEADPILRILAGFEAIRFLAECMTTVTASMRARPRGGD